MNLFHKKSQIGVKQNHQEFWNKTKLAVKSARKFDTLDLYHPDHLNSFEKFLNDISINKSQQSLANPQGLQSIVNSNALVTENRSVISLILKTQHALIVIESFTNQGLRMDWFDFVVKYKPQSHSHFNKINRLSFGLLAHPELMLNKREIGMVRYCPTNNGNSLINIPADMTKEELFNKLNWNRNSNSWLVPVENVKAMLSDIRTDYDKALSGTLKFKFCGHVRHSAPAGDILANCKTWAISKLKKANIDVEIDNNFTNKIVAHTIAIGR